MNFSEKFCGAPFRVCALYGVSHFAPIPLARTKPQRITKSFGSTGPGSPSGLEEERRPDAPSGVHETATSFSRNGIASRDRIFLEMSTGSGSSSLLPGQFKRTFLLAEPPTPIYTRRKLHLAHTIGILRFTPISLFRFLFSTSRASPMRDEKNTFSDQLVN